MSRGRRLDRARPRRRRRLQPYACALVDRTPQLHATVFSRAPVDPAARTRLAERGYSDRVEVASGDMFTDPFPADHDFTCSRTRRTPVVRHRRVSTR